MSHKGRLFFPKQLQELQNDLSNHNVADLLARGHLRLAEQGDGRI